MAIAYEAGAVLSDMEFVQFHPTALAVKGAPRFLLSEALRGEGGVLRNNRPRTIYEALPRSARVASRDIVARAIVSEMHRTPKRACLSGHDQEERRVSEETVSRIYETCAGYGLDLASDMAPSALRRIT